MRPAAGGETAASSPATTAAAQTRRQPPDLVQSARDQRRARIAAATEAVRATGGDGDDVLERAADGDPDYVLGGVNAQTRAREGILHPFGGGGVGRGGHRGRR